MMMLFKECRNMHIDVVEGTSYLGWHSSWWTMGCLSSPVTTLDTFLTFSAFIWVVLTVVILYMHAIVTSWQVSRAYLCSSLNQTINMACVIWLDRAICCVKEIERCRVWIEFAVLANFWPYFYFYDIVAAGGMDMTWPSRICLAVSYSWIWMDVNLPKIKRAKFIRNLITLIAIIAVS